METFPCNLISRLGSTMSSPLNVIDPLLFSLAEDVSILCVIVRWISQVLLISVRICPATSWVRSRMTCTAKPTSIAGVGAL